ncbi:hypothetical protein O181_029193 [Austropuccinia psidii MF-1]|uniref:Uncharacterized protein n=1 Tax=Austropuccinia psidii MF-1 TaxID=1389203 RepID=A0A9Q3CV93_9BASI|nr:hypothetical protein [Austropuccinia psidii MF-1]
MSYCKAIEPERAYPNVFRLTRSGKTTKLPSDFTPLRNHQISDHESPFFQIPGSMKESVRIIGQDPDFFQPEAERAKPYDTEIVGPGERSTKKPQIAVNTSDEASIPKIIYDIPPQNEHSSVTPESRIKSNRLRPKMSQF